MLCRQTVQGSSDLPVFVKAIGSCDRQLLSTDMLRWGLAFWKAPFPTETARELQLSLLSSTNQMEMEEQFTQVCQNI